MADDGCRDGARVLIASNRGPGSFGRGADGTLRCRPGAGGLVSALSAVTGHDGLPAEALWICAAMSDDDRAAVRSAPGGRLDLAGYDTGAGPVRMLAIDRATFDIAYNQIANATLWFVHHLLFDTANRPLFDSDFRRAWTAYVDYNLGFAHALADEAATGARVVVQDYHLSLVPAMLRTLRPDLRIAHFSHTPWAPPDYYEILPDDIATGVLEGLLAADHLGFLTARWARAFADCCRAVLGARVLEERPDDGSGEGRSEIWVEHAGRRTRLGVHPLGVDAEALRARVDEPDVRARMAVLRAALGDRRLIVRVDREELSKNIVRGLQAYRSLLRRHPEWIGRVVHVVFAYESRNDLPQYREYAASVEQIAREIREEFQDEEWTPLVVATDDDLPRSLAAYRLADVAIVNPIRDGMNLVAKEVSVACDNDCVLVLSREAGAADELGDHAVLINPFDVEATAEALHEALTMPPEARATRAAGLAAASGAHPPTRWLSDQLAALGED